MNRIVLIGNGFDKAHGLQTGYEDFINWYWDTRVRGSCHPKGTGIPSFVQFVVLNDEVRCVGDAEEVLGGKNNNGPCVLWFR